MTDRSRRALALVLVTAAVAAACGGGGDDADLTSGAGEIQPVAVGDLPTEIGGLGVEPEDLGEGIGGVGRSYLEEVGLFSLRDGDLLQATLQIARFDADVETDDEFRDQLVAQIGGVTPRQVRVGDDTVFLTTSTSQRLAVWFRDRTMLILATRDEFATPRTLLRQALEVEL